MSFKRWGSGCARLFGAFLIAGLLAFSVAACGGGSSSSSGGGEETEANSGAGESTTASGGAEAGEPILIGLALAKTGVLAPYDIQPGEALELSVKRINEEGGVDGRELETKWIDTKSDKTVGASVATQLVNEGAVTIVTTCDFDSGSPAALAAENQHVPAISLCASSPKNATPAIIGELGYSMGTGSDTEGVTAAEWAFETKKWKKAYVLTDTSLEYSKATTQYFIARFEELGGEIIGEDEFVGGENTEVSAQATRAQSASAGAEFVYIGSWLPGGAIAARQFREAGITLPIVSTQADDGLLMKQLAGDLSNYYSMPLACIPTYCKGNGPAQKAVDQFTKEFQAETGEELASSYPINGYDLGTVLKQAIEAAGGTEPEAIGKAIETMGPVKGLTSSFEFTEACHRPVGQTRTVIEWNNGEGNYLSTLSPKVIPDVGDANPCSGPQATP